MRYIEFNNNILIPVEKIVRVGIDENDKKKVVISLHGGFTQYANFPTEQKAKESYDFIKQNIEDL